MGTETIKLRCHKPAVQGTKVLNMDYSTDILLDGIKTNRICPYNIH